MIRAPDLGILSDRREQGYLNFHDLVLGAVAHMARRKGRDTLIGFLFGVGHLKEFTSGDDYLVDQLARYYLRLDRVLPNRATDLSRLRDMRQLEDALEALVTAGKLKEIRDAGTIIYQGIPETEKALERLRSVAKWYYPFILSRMERFPRTLKTIERLAWIAVGSVIGSVATILVQRCFSG